jgi:hypothetical protein
VKACLASAELFLLIERRFQGNGVAGVEVELRWERSGKARTGGGSSRHHGEEEDHAEMLNLCHAIAVDSGGLQSPAAAPPRQLRQRNRRPRIFATKPLVYHTLISWMPVCCHICQSQVQGKRKTITVESMSNCFFPCEMQTRSRNQNSKLIF